METDELETDVFVMTNIVVPELGESVVEARVAKWLKKEGDPVDIGEPLVELETEKIDLEVSADRAGVLTSIRHAEGDDVKVGEVLAVLGSERRHARECRRVTPRSDSGQSRAAGRCEGHPHGQKRRTRGRREARGRRRNRRRRPGDEGRRPAGKARLQPYRTCAP